MWYCPKCGESLEDQFDTCWKCAGEGNGGVDAEESPVEGQFAGDRQRACPDCDGALEPIRLIDATTGSWDGEGAAHIELSFAASDATRSFFSGKIPRLGVVKGFICTVCGRILLYGEEDR